MKGIDSRTRNSCVPNTPRHVATLACACQIPLPPSQVVIPGFLEALLGGVVVTFEHGRFFLQWHIEEKCLARLSSTKDSLIANMCEVNAWPDQLSLRLSPVMSG